MRTNTHTGTIIKPLSVKRLNKFLARVTHEKYGSRNILISKMSSNLKAVMV